MRNLVKLVVCACMLFTFISCEEETTIVPQENEASLQMSIENEANLKNLVTNIIAQSEANGKIAYATIMYDGDDFITDKIVYSVVTKEQYLAVKPKGVNMSDSEFLRGDTVTITCTFPDGSIDSINCQSGDLGCIGLAVQACLNEGGCAESCRQVITYIPKNFK